LALYDNSKTAALVGNATIVGGDAPHLYVRTKSGHLIEFVPGGDVESYWTPTDFTDASKKCIISGDIASSLGASYQILSVSRGTLFLAMRNGTTDHPWLAVAIKVSGATSAVGLPNGGVAVMAGNKLITVST
jgi:hypothetical protein